MLTQVFSAEPAEDTAPTSLGDSLLDGGGAMYVLVTRRLEEGKAARPVSARVEKTALVPS